MSPKSRLAARSFLMTFALLSLTGGCPPTPSVGGDGISGGSNSGPNGNLPVTALRPPGIYVTNQNNSITVFSLDASGNAKPQRTISGPSTGLSLPIGIAMDSKGDLYVANRTGSSVTVYAGDASGDAAPKRILIDPDMRSPASVAIGIGDEVFVTTCPGCGTGAGGQTGIFHFNNGADKSDFRIGGYSNVNTRMTYPGGINVYSDPLNPTNYYVIIGNSFGGPIEVFGARTPGDQFPVRTLAPRAGANLQGLAVAGNAIFLAIPGAVIDIYPIDALPTASPSATIPSSPQFPIVYPASIAVDAGVSPPIGYILDFSGDALFVMHTVGVAPNLTLDAVTQVVGDQTKLDGPLGVLVVR